MKTIGAFEAKNRFGHWLELVERGEEIAITRHGRAVARLVPARPVAGREQARAAIERMRRRAQEFGVRNFSWPEWKRYRDQGRP